LIQQLLLLDPFLSYSCNSRYSWSPSLSFQPQATRRDHHENAIAFGLPPNNLMVALFEITPNAMDNPSIKMEKS
jgi:hypothetical protein